MLERLDPEQWGKKNSLQSSGQVEHDHVMIDGSKLSDLVIAANARALLESLAGAVGRTYCAASMQASQECALPWVSRAARQGLASEVVQAGVAARNTGASRLLSGFRIWPGAMRRSVGFRPREKGSRRG